MKMYDYLVAYNFNAEGFLTACHGTMQISRKKKIKTFEDINEVVQCITDGMNGYKNVYNVSIYNFILLGYNKH
jgi:hypothetical protein